MLNLTYMTSNDVGYPPAALNEEQRVLTFLIPICFQAGRTSTVTQDLFDSRLPAEMDELKAELTLCSMNEATFQ